MSSAIHHKNAGPVYRQEVVDPNYVEAENNLKHKVVGAVNRVQEAIKPDCAAISRKIAVVVHQAHEKKNLKNIAGKCKIASIASLVAAVALAVIGIAFAPVGIPLILVALPLGYLAYNSYQVSKNLKRVAENPNKYMNMAGLGDYSKEKLRKCLLKKTFAFGWGVDIAVEIAIDKSIENKKKDRFYP